VGKKTSPLRGRNDEEGVDESKVGKKQKGGAGKNARPNAVKNSGPKNARGGGEGTSYGHAKTETREK